MAQRQGAHLLRQFDRMAARLGPEHLATTSPLRHRLVAVTGTAGALLLVHLLARDRYLRAILGVMRTGHALQELIAHHAVDQIGARFEPEDGVAELNLTGARRIKCGNGGPHDGCSAVCAPADWAASALPPDLRKAPGCGASLGRGRLTASRTSTQPPLVPGTAPRTSTRPLSLSVCTTSRLSVVTRSLPR